MNYASRKLNICLPPHFRFNFFAVVVVANHFKNMFFESNRKQLNRTASKRGENIADCCIVALLLHCIVHVHKLQVKIQQWARQNAVQYNWICWLLAYVTWQTTWRDQERRKWERKKRDRKETRLAERFVCVTSRRLCVIHVLHLVLRVLPSTECGKTEVENAFHACHVAWHCGFAVDYCEYCFTVSRTAPTHLHRHLSSLGSNVLPFQSNNVAIFCRFLFFIPFNFGIIFFPEWILSPHTPITRKHISHDSKWKWMK